MLKNILAAIGLYFVAKKAPRPCLLQGPHLSSADISKLS